jgi:hypothetical protein
MGEVVAVIPDDVLAAAVRSAFALGWHIAELHYCDDRQSTVPENRLRQISALDSQTRTNLLLAQVSVDLDALGVERQGVVRPLRSRHGLADRSDDPAGALDPIELTLGSELDVRPLHVAITLRLFVKDFELGKAYALGTNLGQLVLDAYDQVRPDKHPALKLEDARTRLSEAFDLERVVQIWSSVKDLKSRFPPYAADPVAATIHDWYKWTRWADRGRSAGSEERVDDRLYRQGQLWRALLSGERDPKDCLLFGNYVDAASDMVRTYGSLAGRVVARRWGAALLVLVVAAFAVVVLIAAQRWVNNVAATLAGLVAALGVSWAGIVTALKRAIRPVEHALWETQMTAAIAYAISHVPELPPDSAVLKLRDGDPGLTGPVIEDPRPRPRSWFGHLRRRLAAIGHLAVPS